VSFNADLFGFHGFVGLEVVHRPAGAPSPRPLHASIIRTAGQTRQQRASSRLGLSIGYILPLIADWMDGKV
jgi:hypothetical protein